MANHKATGKKAAYGPELAQRSRAAVLNALDVIQKRGKCISELLADEIESNPIKFMELASKFCPKDINVSEGETAFERILDNATDEDLTALFTTARLLSSANSSKEGAEEAGTTKRLNKVH